MPVCADAAALSRHPVLSTFTDAASPEPQFLQLRAESPPYPLKQNHLKSGTASQQHLSLAGH